MPSVVRVANLAWIERFAAQAAPGTGRDVGFIVRAGDSKVRSAPHGMGSIASKGTLGVTGGITRINSAAAFTTPTFVTQKSSVGEGQFVRHFAQVQCTSAIKVGEQV